MNKILSKKEYNKRFNAWLKDLKDDDEGIEYVYNKTNDELIKMFERLTGQSVKK